LKNMKIAMISTPFLRVPPLDYGGTELVVHELVEGLVHRGHDVTLFATGDSLTEGELRWRYPKGQWPPDILAELDHAAWAMESVAAETFDLVHAHSAPALAVRRFVPRCPLAYTLHHPRDERLQSFYHHYHDAHFIAISADQARRAMPLPRLTVIHHGVDPSDFQAVPVPSDFVGFVGRLAEVKGVATAIDAARAAGLPIRIGGAVHSPDQAYADRELTHRLAQPHVTFLGPVNLEAKSALLRDARALLAPITWDEPFGLIAIEAMLSGCPVVGFPRGSLPELIEAGVTGYLASDERAMVDLIRPGGPLESFDRLRCRARAIERFSSDRMVADHERLYSAMVAAPRKALPARASRVA
jgi:glycosyltransferase involved in cell wall biosynthesis